MTFVLTYFQLAYLTSSISQELWMSNFLANDAEGIRMRISVAEAESQPTELVRRAEAGDEVILTSHGHAAVRLVPIKAAQDRKSRRTLLEAARTSGSSRAKSGPTAARSQDFLYWDDGLHG
jgi:prevent-host-death family protein